jgi:Flp pilus assembly pilin Flp
VSASLRRILDRARRRLKDRSGQALVEYGLILVLVAIGAIVGLGFFGHTVSDSLNSSGNILHNLP